MATTNVTVTQTWTKLAEDSDDPILISFSTPVFFEVATTATDVAPVVSGHQLQYDDQIVREVIGPGFIWARIINSPTTITSGLAVVTK